MEKYNRKEHWENMFSTKAENQVSWYQPNPETSVNFFIENKIPKIARIIEIGGGDSYLIDKLLELGYENLTLLDISENAIERIKKRLGENSEKVRFIVSDVLDFHPEEKFDVWHDRASFHFLTDSSEIKKYEETVASSLAKNGFLFIGTFSENGPLKCSGLEIKQYSEEKFEKIFSEDFAKLKCFNENHKTPFETIQNFIFCISEKSNY